METKILKPTKENILKVVESLKKGEVLAVPTETVYGLVADAFCCEAVETIFKIKEREKEKALSCNISDFEMLFRLTNYESEIFKKLREKFWPGPLTIVVEKKPSVLDLVTARKKTVAIRFSSNEILKKLTNLFGGPLVVPSANISKNKSKINAKDVYEELNGKVKYIVDGGESEHKIESTIVSIEGDELKILRYGAIREEEIFSVI